jgi:small GTP-binding protein
VSLAIQDYAELKLEIAAPIRSLLELARLSADENAERDARDLLARLAEDRFNLAVVGVFNRGKSSLINRMLGTTRLPTGVVPLTSVITTVGYGDRERLLLHVGTSHYPREESPEKLADFVSERGNPGNRLGIEQAELRLPVEMLRLGFFFVDTPGVGSAITANTRTTRRFLPEIDAAVFVTSFEAPLAESDVELYGELRQAVRSVFVVANKSDLVTAAERDEALRYMHERLGQTSNGRIPDVLAVSAKSGEGISELHDALSRFLREDKLRELLFGILRRAFGISQRIAGRLAIRESMQSDPDRPAQLRERFRAEIARVDADKHRLTEALRPKVTADLVSRMSPAIESYCAGLSGPGMSLNAWLGDNRATLQSLLLELASPGEMEFAALLRSAEQALAGADAGASVGGMAAEISSRSLFEEALPPAVPVRRFEWPVPREPFWARFPLLRSRAERIRERHRASALGAYQREIEQLVRAYANAWIDQVSAAFDRRLAGVVAATDAALSKPIDPEASAEFLRTRERLEQLEHRLSRDGAEPQQEANLPQAAEARLGRCRFCVAVRDAVFSFLSREQYDLHISGQRRLERVAHGFCALHAWQFERIASPQGVCVAYAPVLAHLGETFASLAERESLGEMRDGLRDLRPTRETCPACRVARAAEESVLRNAASIGAMLCLPHLELVLERTDDADLTRRVLDRQAANMRRASVDMQNYALKFDAIRRYLLTDSEAVAHLRGISAVAGEIGVRSVSPGTDDG